MLLLTLIAIMVQLSSASLAHATEPDKTPPVVTLSGTAVKAVEEGKTTGTYELHIVATDGSKTAPQSGVAKIEVGVDGSGQQSWEKSCPEGSCGLEETWTYAAGNFPSEGPAHVITVKVADHAGNVTEERISWEGVEEVPGETAPKETDTTAPAIGLTGSAVKAAEEGAIEGEYELHIAATDGSPSAPQSGVYKIEVGVDGTTLQSWEKYCPVGSCRLEVNWPYQPGNFPGEGHVITVTVRDHGGNVKTRTIVPAVVTPVAAYPFEEDSGAVAHDVTGNGHEGALSTKGVEWGPGKYGTALKFDGKEGCVTVPDSPALRLREEFTVEAWVRPEGELLHLPTIVKQAEGFPAYGLGVGLTTAGRAEGQIGTEAKSHTDLASSSSLEANVWSHEALTFDGQRLRLYVNGKLVATKSVEKTYPAASGPLEIGCSASGHFRGSIDEVRVFGRTLEPTEVADSQGPMPTAETMEAYGVEGTEAIFSANIDPHGLETAFRFEYGPTTSYGQSVPEVGETNEQLEFSPEATEVEEAVDGLKPETAYHYRVVATNVAGAIVGHDHTLTTGAAGLSPAVAGGHPSVPWIPANRYGLDWSGNQSLAKKEADIDLTHEAGASIYRVLIKEANTDAEKLFLYAAKRHVTLLPIVVGITGANTEKLIPPLKGSPLANETRENWEKQLEKLLNKYGPEGGFWNEAGHKEYASYAPEWWEIWNEENYATQGAANAAGESIGVIPSRYAELLEAARSAFGKADKEAKILFGGILSVAGNDPKGAFGHIRIGTFIKHVGHPNDYDALGLHPYAFTGKKGARPVAGNVETVTEKVRKNIQKAHGALEYVRGEWNKANPKNQLVERPIWITEIGWPVKGHGAWEDHLHLLVEPSVQRILLEHSFSMIEEVAPHFDIRELDYYNAYDNTEASPEYKPTKEDHEGAANWDFHCGLVEDLGGYGEEKGNARGAWQAFVDKIKN